MLICQLTDLHVRPFGIACNRVSETNMMTERALRAVAAFSPRPDVVLITGDLTECGRPDEYDMVAEMIDRAVREAVRRKAEPASTITPEGLKDPSTPPSS